MLIHWKFLHDCRLLLQQKICTFMLVYTTTILKRLLHSFNFVCFTKTLGPRVLGCCLTNKIVLVLNYFTRESKS
jgi:hypothetical protein